jgi:hypothetical protein
MKNLLSGEKRDDGREWERERDERSRWVIWLSTWLLMLQNLSIKWCGGSCILLAKEGTGFVFGFVLAPWHVQISQSSDADPPNLPNRLCYNNKLACFVLYFNKKPVCKFNGHVPWCFHLALVSQKLKLETNFQCHFTQFKNTFWVVESWPT